MAHFYESFYDFDHYLDQLLQDDPRFFRRTPRPAVTAQQPHVPAVRTMKPHMDLHENVEANTVTATFELPGLKKEDVKIDLHNGRLTVSAESKVSSEHEEGGYAVRERRFGKLSRTLQLPVGVKEQDIKASMEDGVLTLTFPRSGPEAEPKRIMIL